MINLAQFFDSYSRQARLYPALLTLVPPIAMFAAYFPKVLNIGQTIMAVVAGCGILFFLADFARTRGKRIEPLLLEKWGGWPTTIWLRHRDLSLPAGTKTRYHSFFARQPVLEAFPTAQDESRDPKSADEAYAAGAMWLKERCRGSAFPLVEKENATYGFRRNLLGLKPIGIGLCIATALVPLVSAALNENFDFHQPVKFVAGAYLNSGNAIMGIVAGSIVVLMIWISTVNIDWVRQAGDQYARALLANCDTL